MILLGGGIQLIYASELEISTSSSLSFEDAENTLKSMASCLGFNAIINAVRSQHTEGMVTQGTEQTDTKYSTKSYFSPTILSNGVWGVSKNKVVDKSSSTTNINTQTTINNVFTIKGTLALIGKENQKDGEEYDFEILEQNCKERYELVKTLQNVYWPNQELKMIAENNTKALGGIIIIGLIIALICLYSFSYITGLIIFGIYFLCSWACYSVTKDNENKAYEMLAPLDSELKALVDEYGEVIFDIYQLSPYITLKHVGE